MDFDNIISVLILLIFFVIPSLASRLKKRIQGKSGEEKTATKIGSAISDILKLLRQREKFQRESPIELAREKSTQVNREEYQYEEPIREFQENVQQEKSQFLRKTAIEANLTVPPPITTPERHESRGRSSMAIPPIRCRVKATQLQKAVIWAEILGKPVALRTEKEECVSLYLNHQ